MAYRFIEETFTPTHTHVATVGVSSGGTGYAVDDILTIVGGTGTAATIRVTGVSGGVITTVAIETSGLYTSNPSSPNSATGGTGSSASLTLTFDTEKGYIMASKGILDALTLGHVTGLSLVAGGTGYVVGDILSISTGTALFKARIEVTDVSSGVITAFKMRSSGVYSTLPDITAASHATTGGTGSSATFSVDSIEAPYTATIGSGGSSYVVGDIITVSGGTLHAGESAYQFIVTAESGGVVTAVEPYRIGRYDALPTNPASTTGGSGSSLTLNLVHSMWMHPDAISNDYFDGITEFEWFVEGVNAAGGNPVCGATAINSGSYRWLGLKVATAFDNTKTFELQPNASPGDFTTPSAVGGPRLCSTDSAVTVFLNWSARTINIVLRTAPTYEHGYMGLFLPFVDSPSTKYPYPLLCAGTTRSSTIGINTAFVGRNVNSESTMHASVLHHGEGASDGPHLARNLVGAWVQFEVEQSADGGFCLWPLNGDVGGATPAYAPNIDTGSGTVTPTDIVDAGLSDDNSGTSTDGPYNSNTVLNPTPFGPTGEDLYFLTAPLLYEINGSIVQLYGELEGVYYINGRGLSAEDRIEDAAGVRYFVFTDALSNENINFIALREG